MPGGEEHLAVAVLNFIYKIKEEFTHFFLKGL